MTTEIPEWIAAEGNVSIYYLPAAADLSKITMAEFAAGVDITCYLPTAWEGITGEQNKVEQTRMCLKESFEVLGKIKRSISDFTATYLPQAGPDDPANKVKTMMAGGSNGVIAVRYGVEAITPIEVGQTYDAIRVTNGLQNKNTTASEEGAPLTYTQSVSAQGGLVEDGKVVA